MAVIRRRKDRKGQYELHYVDVDGKRYRINTGTTDDDLAGLWLAKAEEKLSRARLGDIPKAGRISRDDIFKEEREERKNRERLRLEDFQDKYHQKSKTRLKKSTLQLDRYAFNSIRNSIGNKYLEEITSEDIDNWMEVLDEKGRSRTTRKMYFNQLSVAFNYAVQQKWIQENPFRSVDIENVKKNQSRRLPMKVNEARRFLEEADREGNYPLPQYFRALFYTGCRRDEILRLKGEHVDLENKNLTVKITKRRGTEVTVRIPMIDALYEVFKDMELKPEQYVFKSSYGGNIPSEQRKLRKQENIHLHSDSVTHAFKRILRKAGLPQNYTLHSIRHTYANYLHSQGVSIDVIQRLLSHTSSRMTWGTYSHTEALNYRDVANRINFEPGKPLEDRMEE